MRQDPAISLKWGKGGDLSQAAGTGEERMAILSPRPVPSSRARNFRGRAV